MPETLNVQNANINAIKNLYIGLHKGLVYLPFNAPHNVHDNEIAASNFFKTTIKPMFQEEFDAYPGSTIIEKVLNVIKEIRGKVLDTILDSLSELYDNNVALDAIIQNIITIITKYKDKLVEADFGCIYSYHLRLNINALLNINPTLNSHQALGAYRFFDPENYRRSGVFLTNLLSYQDISGKIKLSMFGTPIDNELFGDSGSSNLHTAEVIAFYYLATKEQGISSCEQKERFNSYMLMVTQALRAYNEFDYQSEDLPSCHSGIKDRLVTYGAVYGDKFLLPGSLKNIVEGAISKEVCDRVKKVIKFMTPFEAMELSLALTPIFSDNFAIVIANPKLLQKRCDIIRSKFISLLKKSNNSNSVGYVVYRQGIVEYFFHKIHEAEYFFYRLRDNIVKADIDQEMRNILSSYNLYNKDIQTFGRCFFDFIVKRRELGLIFYALLDPAFCCYNEVVQLCNSKQLKGPINGYDAQIIANNIKQKLKEQLFYLMPEIPLCVLGMECNMAILIESYLDRVYCQEQDRDFINRITQEYYIDYNEPNPNSNKEVGLGSIINPVLLLAKPSLIYEIAQQILLEIKKALDPAIIEIGTVKIQQRSQDVAVLYHFTATRVPDVCFNIEDSSIAIEHFRVLRNIFNT